MPRTDISKSSSARWLPYGWLVLTLALGFLAVGCASPEKENRSERPWNTPKSWEHGLPSGTYERR
jgi:hypothetical protein